LVKYILLLSFLIGYTVVANFSILLERPSHQLLFFLVAGLIVADYNTIVRQSAKKSIAVLPVALVLILVGTGTLILSVDSIKNEEHVFKGLAARQAKNHALAKKEFEAINIERYSLDFAATPIAWYLGEYYALNNDYKTALSYYEKANIAHPNHVYNIANIGVAYFQLNDKTKAIEFLKKAVAIAPAFTEANLNLCAIYLENDDYYTALQYFLNAYPSPKSQRYLAINKIMLGRYIDIFMANNMKFKYKKYLPQLKSKPLDLLGLHFWQFQTKKKLEDLVIIMAKDKKYFDLPDTTTF